MELQESYVLDDINPIVILRRFSIIYSNFEFLVSINAPDAVVLNYINILAEYYRIVEANFYFEDLSIIQTRLLAEELRRMGGIMEL